ncbi:DNA repair protein RecN [Ventosimonas gracilis]|uniref:DNA repair protein RecN n=1 Tax=Ventosimonas gracilis TaxID=1680762 RepID=A0A139SX33_9GAMM|nr:DNA repair protein RecN [Ventosimonas gracilis]KXU38951.1 DNA repair protein RecN [Ventosimonas gracilis]
MLLQLSIRNYALVSQLDLELAAGMTVITGETGAGKSIMLDALGLALGDRADGNAVRPGTDKADILAAFDLSQSPEAASWLSQRDLEQDGLCLLRRVVSSEGRSRGYINGTPCPLSDLKALGELLLDIHSQHEHQSLLQSETQRRLLDNFAGSTDLAKSVQRSAQQCQQLRSQLNRLSQADDEQRARQQLLRYQLEELDLLALAEGEWEQLEQEHQTLSGAADLLSSCAEVLALSEADGGHLLAALSGSLHRLTSCAPLPEALGEVCELLESAQIQIEEAVSSAQRFIDHFDNDPERAQFLEERISSVYSLARKHRVQPSELHRHHQQLAAELASISADEQTLGELDEALTAALQSYQQQAGELSAQREEAAARLSAAVEAQMQRLGMQGGRFVIALHLREHTEPHAGGQEQVEFLVSANPGSAPRPLIKVASGGELSRISLAIQVIAAQTSRVPTLIFDEVDVGIGGPTAEVVGQLLRQLGSRGQVLVVTHLAQVAAQGHQHLLVEKRSDAQSTQTAVLALDNKGRHQEIARMLGGVEITAESLAHAHKMLANVQG